MRAAVTNAAGQSGSAGDVQRRNVAVPDRFLAPRVRGDALDGQVNFDEALGVGHGGKAKG